MFKETVNSAMSFGLEGDFKIQYRINTRVLSWLRTNAGGVPNTCKSSGDVEELALKHPSGGRVSNA